LGDESREEAMNAMNTINRISKSAIAAIIMIASFTGSVNAQELKSYNPYTVVGHQLRSELITQSPFGGEAPVKMGPTLFQEVVPCMFVSTLDEDKYPAPWGGKAFQAKESRTYFPIGILVSGDFTNPCSEVVPEKAIAVALRITAFDPNGSGAVYVAPSTFTSYSYPAVQFKDGHDARREADVALHAGGFRVEPNEDTHVVIEIIGYFIPDASQGNVGPQGAQGAKGEKGDKGDKGDPGVAGAQGNAGAQGEKGDKGDKGDPGVAGAQGNAGAQGEKGDKGDKGEAGAQGLKGDKGEAGAQGLKGDKGEAGAQGLKGDKGEAGAQGLKGDKGDAGAQGAQGLKGDKGDRGDNGAQGAQGPQGPMGLQGPAGPQGPQGPAGPVSGLTMVTSGKLVFPPGGTITITDANVRANSVIIPYYVELSNGNAIAIAVIGNGQFVASGSPNKAFRYAVFNNN
jgi:hypothetical protein